MSKKYGYVQKKIQKIVDNIPFPLSIGGSSESNLIPILQKYEPSDEIR